MPKSTKHQREAEAKLEKQCEQIDKEMNSHVHEDANDAKQLEEILVALKEFNADKARDILQHSISSIEYLIKPKAKADRLTSPLTCKYALHAVLAPLVSEKCHDVLDNMNDEDIQTLKKCISIAKFYPRPSKSGNDSDIATTEEKISTRKEILHVSSGGSVVPVEHALSENQIIVLKRELKVYQLEKEFTEEENADKKQASEFWSDAIAELDRWFNAIETYKRTSKYVPLATEVLDDKKGEPKAEKILIKDQDLLLTIKQVAERLGTTPQKVYAHISRCLNGKNQDSAAKVKEYFVFTTKEGKKQVQALRESCFEEYKKLFASIRKYNRKPKEIEETANAQDVAHKTLLDVKATESTATAIIRLIEIAAQYDIKHGELESAKNDLTLVQKAMIGQTDPQKVDELANKILAANTVVKQKTTEFETCVQAKNLLNKKDSAQTAKAEAEQSLVKATKDLDEVFVNIATFLESVKQNQH